jgi:hypothetical protein
VCELGNIYIYVSISSNHKCCIEGGLINFNYKRNLAFRIILAFFPSLVANVLRHNHLVEPGVEGRKVTSQLYVQVFLEICKVYNENIWVIASIHVGLYYLQVIKH